MLGICLGLQLALERVGGGRRRRRASASCPAARCACARAAFRAWAGRRSTARRLLLRALLRRRDAVRDRLVGRHRRRGALGLVPRRASSTPRRAAPPARATSTACCGGEGAIPLPRLIPCLDVAGGRVVKGVKFQGLRDVGDPVELGAAYSDARRRRARLPRRQGDARGARRRSSALVAPRRRAARDPVHGRRRHPHASPTPTSCSRPAPTRSPSTRRRSRGPSLITELAERLGSQAVVVAIDTEGGRVRTRAGTTETARDTVEWAREAEERGAGEILLTSIDADGTRAGLRPRDHARRSPTRSTCR